MAITIVHLALDRSPYNYYDGGMPRTSTAKSRFIETAVALFRARGYHGVGLAEIIEQAKAPKGSFYFHFPGGKEELAEEAIRYAGGYLPHLMQKYFAHSNTLAAGIDGIVTHLARNFEASGWSLGCPVASVMLDTTPASERLSRVFEEVTEKWIVCISENFERFGEPEPRKLAIRFLIALEGAWLVARVLKSREPFVEAVSSVTAGLK
ncbi:TetR/AcrR family transcriptional regulator [Phyllobacterium sp. YR531]|uniref:TetR/AcrR family transcriptional regulator n=1 Tax=Phyllobacterium sp. YR531 TaxID=1144343 RepID=UPI00026F758A|nr:TetR/AcrR family transcriptional regulator [Phyllobacterium sp. YR531]EJN02070.1 transcriptional regulator [Phyllobacterium sp. YR531]